MDNQHQKITGYRELTLEEIALMNEVKEVGAVIEALVLKLDANDTVLKRWVAIGRTDLQTGLMALVRSIAQPTSF